MKIEQEYNKKLILMKHLEKVQEYIKRWDLGFDIRIDEFIEVLDDELKNLGSELSEQKESE